MGWTYWRGEELKANMFKAEFSAVKKTCDAILEIAKNEVPLDEGTLMRSGVVLMAPQALAASGIISFGGGPGTGHPIIPYAKRWHENSANFQRGRKRFYLKDPLNKYASAILKKALEQEISALLSGV